jgi:6-pyruvoyltetrahydropterin/6-carboxytetrahydropterin synthase
MRAVRRIQFCAGHRVVGHEGKCRHPHGHNYVVFFHAEADGLDDLGRVIDFSALKSRLGGWIEEHWDHGFVVASFDLAMGALLHEFRDCEGSVKMSVLPSNPTAENMADYLLRVVGPQELHGTGVRLVRVVLWETENCYADVGV